MPEMTAQEAAEWGKTLSFEKVWAAFMETNRKFAETDRKFAETDRKFMETDRKFMETDRKFMETDRKFAETDRKFAEAAEYSAKVDAKIDRLTETVDKMAKRVDRVTANVGGLNLSMGELVETLFAPHLGEKFDPYQYNLRRTFKRVPIYDDTSRLRGEIDILLSNTTICMAVEIKRWLDQTGQVDEHVKRMQLIRTYPPAEAKGKTLIGAIAAGTVYPDVREYAEQSGFFVLELTGEDVRLLEPPQSFKPKEW
ncbi:MAG: hypothetical protein LBF60_04450 [Treponema sp.]|nr:hypothetical protein [Treponema sp.]